MVTSGVHTWAATMILLMSIVIVVMDWVPTALNRNIKGMSARERLPSTLIHSTLGAVFAVTNVLVVKWAILAGAVWYSVALLAAIRNWWLPYLAGVHWGEITPQIYRQNYAGNSCVLPRFNDNPIIPDVQHMLIHLSALAACGLSWWSFRLA